MKNALLLLSLIILSTSIFGQVSFGGHPIEWEGKSTDDVVYRKFKVNNLSSFKAEDVINDQDKEIPYRFGVNIETSLDMENNGSWRQFPNDDRVWRMGIEMPGAVTINFEFDQYEIPEGAEIYIYNESQTQIIGKFTSANASKINSLGVGLIPSDKIIIEYYEPNGVDFEGQLHINQVTYGYRDAILRGNKEEKAGPFGNSGACNIDVNCADIPLYAFQKKSVALYVLNGNSICTGAMVNNTLQDQHPFFLTANHCLPGNINNLQNWVFYFNHEVPECGGSDDDAPVNQTVSGSSLLASNQESDFALLELNENVPASYDICYSGWDATDETSTVSSAYGIHHPRGDVKKICFEEDAPYHDIGTAGFVNQTWFIDQWEEGTTEGGSSGSPLFNQSGLIIGQLGGGAASCTNISFDYYGRMGISWDFGSTAQSRLSDWLDPAETGQLIIGNSCAAEAPENDLTLGGFESDEIFFCSLVELDESITVINTGSNDITSFTLNVTFNGNDQGEIDWSGSIGSFSATTVELGTFQTVNGVNTLLVEIVDVNGGEDSNSVGNEKEKEVEATSDPETITLVIQLDEYPDETSWRIQNEGGTIIYSGGGYNEEFGFVEEEYCLAEGCYTFTIEDSFGDGICCEYGDGFYNISDANEVVLISGGEFGDDETQEFCVVPLSIQEHPALSTLTLFPNPVQNSLNIDLGDVQSVDRLVITDLLGRAVYSKNQGFENSSVITVETSNIRSVVYLIQVDTNFGTTTRKIVVE